MLDSGNPTLGRIEDQIAWYDRKSASNQRMFKGLKVVTIVAGVLVPVLTSVTWGRLYAGILGGVIVVVEGLQQLNQYQATWISYRSTCESLKHEKYLYLGGAGPYATATNPLPLFAERIEALVSQEHAKWLPLQVQKSQRLTESVRPRGIG